MESLFALRSELKRRGLDGFLLPVSGPRRLPLPESERHVAWLSGFTGSAGSCVVLRNEAALFVDGRYETQAKEEVSPTLWQVFNTSRVRPMAWLESKMTRSSNRRIGYDPWLHSIDEGEGLSMLEPVDGSPIDAIRGGHASGESKLEGHGLEYAGCRVRDKIQLLQPSLVGDAYLLTSPESIAWLTNTRGGDFPHVPCCRCLALMYRDHARIDLFLRPDQMPEEGPGGLGKIEDEVHIRACDTLLPALEELRGQRVQIDRATCSLGLETRLRAAGIRVISERDPCLLPKAIKNETEVQNARTAHIIDGVALVRFLSWLDSRGKGGEVLDEMEAARKIDDLRAEHPAFCGLSFPTISAFGPNGAIIHYRPSPEKNRRIVGDGLFLLDSGGQYREGTTDVTRTVCIGQPTEAQKEHFTLVLKGHINLAAARFPRGTIGADLHALSRIHLWRHGLDYAHGTGHGVGSYLAVHEGPQSIGRGSSVVLEPGMIVSNEPGLYQVGKYGIRLENLMLVVEDAEMLAFETLTLAPFDLELVEQRMLDTREREWLEAYHKHVYDTLVPYINDSEVEWFLKRTCL